MILVASAVEANLVNTGLFGSLGDGAADGGRGGLVAAVLDLRRVTPSRRLLAETRVAPDSSLTICA